MRPTIALFDIDGTLISCGGAGRRAMLEALESIGAPRAAGDFGYGGMTDRLIARLALVAAAMRDTEAAIDDLIERYLTLLPPELERADTYRVMPGAVALVDSLVPSATLAVGLGTGNVERGARLKLTRAGLAERFAFGGYGCDHEEREKLIGAGADRGAAQLGVGRRDARVIIIGDTPRDVEAAHANGAECIAVATGHYSTDVLADCKPEFLVESLEDPRVLRAIEG